MRTHHIGGKKRRPKSKAERDLQFRAALVQYLGMHPEDLSSRATRYAATTGELLTWVRQKRRERGRLFHTMRAGE